MQYLEHSKCTINGIYKTGNEKMDLKFGLKHKRRKKKKNIKGESL